MVGEPVIDVFVKVTETDPIDSEALLEVCSDPIRDLFLLWQKKKGSDLLPSREAFDVLEFRPWMGRIVLFDVTHDPLIIRYRLVGTQLVAAFGADFTGCSIKDKSYSQNFNASWRNLSTIAEKGIARYRSDANAILDTGENAGERLFLPLGKDGRVDMILAFIDKPSDYRRQQRKRGSFTRR